MLQRYCQTVLIVAVLALIFTPTRSGASLATFSATSETESTSETWPSLLIFNDHQENQYITDHDEEFRLAATATGFSVDSSSTGDSSSTNDLSSTGGSSGVYSHANDTISSTGFFDNNESSSGLNSRFVLHSIVLNVVISVCLMIVLH